MRRNAKAKLRNAGGFSLPELMLTMLILVVVSGIAADGIFTVQRLYQRTVDSVNARTYLNTTILALRSRLSLASYVNTDNTELTYNDPENGYCKISNDATDGIRVEYLDINKASRDPRKIYPILSGTDGFLSSYATIEYDSAAFKVSGLKVTKDGETLAELKNPYIIHTVNPPTN